MSDMHHDAGAIMASTEKRLKAENKLLWDSINAIAFWIKDVRGLNDENAAKLADTMLACYPSPHALAEANA